MAPLYRGAGGGKRKRGQEPFPALSGAGEGYLPPLHRSMLIRRQGGGQKEMRLLPPDRNGRKVAPGGAPEKRFLTPFSAREQPSCSPYLARPHGAYLGKKYNRPGCPD